MDCGLDHAVHSNLVAVQLFLCDFSCLVISLDSKVLKVITEQTQVVIHVSCRPLVYALIG